jgi:hypothetical protein
MMRDSIARQAPLLYCLNALLYSRCDTYTALELHTVVVSALKLNHRVPALGVGKGALLHRKA